LKREVAQLAELAGWQWKGMATFRHQVLPTSWPAHNLVRNREFSESTELAGQQTTKQAFKQQKKPISWVTINWLLRIEMARWHAHFFGRILMDCMDFDLLPLLSYLACRSRIILQVTFAILLDGQSKVASVQLNPGWAATNWYCSILRDLTDQWISRRGWEWRLWSTLLSELYQIIKYVNLSLGTDLEAQSKRKERRGRLCRNLSFLQWYRFNIVDHWLISWNRSLY